jgi:hypothetical protein
VQGPTGATGSVSSTNGLALTGGDVTASYSGTQNINKTGSGDLNLQTGGVTRLNVSGTTGAVTFAPNYAVTTNANASTTSSTWTTTGISATLTTTGRPVLVWLQSSSVLMGYLGATTTSANGGAQFEILRDGSTLVSYAHITSPTTGLFNVPSNMLAIDAGATAGSHTYTLWFKVDVGTSYAYAYMEQIAALEL